MSQFIRSKIVWIILVAVLGEPEALAGPMMPMGTSPESGLAGLWRVIDVQVAPWKPPHALTRKDAPLLEYAVEFADGRTMGPATLACTNAKYSSGVTYMSEAFGGAIAADKDGHLARALGISNPSITTFRLICDGSSRDFYVADDADLRFEDHDVVYTLERPTGMDVEQYKPGYSGPSFDCVTARRTLDRLICIDAGLSKADRALDAVYSATKRTFSSASFASISAAQKAWIASLAPNCGAEGTLPDAGGARNNVADCVMTEYERQIGLLSGLKPARSGSLVIEPRARFRARRSSDESDVYPQMSGGAEAEPFNAFISKILHTDRWRTDDTTLFPDSDNGNVRFRASRSYTIAGFDERIASFQISTDDFTGGNRDALAQRSITWDLVKARPLTLDEIFLPGSQWKTTVIAACKRDLQKQLNDRGGGEVSDTEIAATVSNPSNWLWKRDSATIVFVIDTIGGLPGEEFDVGVPLKTLLPFLRPDAPVR